MQMEYRQACHFVFFVLENFYVKDCSQEVVGCSAGYMGFSSPGCRVEDEVTVVHLFVDLHNARLVAASVAIIWRRKDCDNLLLVRPVVPLYRLFNFFGLPS
jgi:hypothetical protein